MASFQQKAQDAMRARDVMQGDKLHMLGTLNSVLRQNNEITQQLRLYSSGGCNVNSTSGLAGGLGSNNLVMASKTTDEDELEAENKKLLKESDLESLTKGAASFAQTGQSLEPDHHA